MKKIVFTNAALVKKQLLQIATTLSLCLMLGVAASAQTTKTVTVTIPFDFYVGKTALPAGDYTVYRTSANSGNGFLLRAADGQAQVVFNAQEVQSDGTPEATKLEFRRYEDKYFLARFWAAGNNIGRELPRSGLERELAGENTRHLAQKSVKTETVTTQ